MVNMGVQSRVPVQSNWTISVIVSVRGRYNSLDQQMTKIDSRLPLGIWSIRTRARWGMLTESNADCYNLSLKLRILVDSDLP